MSKKSRAQHRRNVRYRLWRIAKAVGNKADDAMQWLFRKVFIPIGALDRWPRLAHLAYAWRTQLSVAMVGLMWGSHAFPHTRGWAWVAMVPSLMFLGAFWLSIVGDVHVTPTGRMCERCLDASFPENGEALAEAKMNRLRFYHFEKTKWDRRLALLLIPWLITLAGYQWFIPWWGNLAVWSVMMLSGAWISAWATRPHRRLRYWCPWCRDGDAALVPEPELDRSA